MIFFTFLIVSFIIFGLIEDAKEKQKSKPQMTYPPKKDNGYSEKIVLKNTDNSVGPILAALAGIIVVCVPLTVLYLIAR